MQVDYSMPCFDLRNLIRALKCFSCEGLFFLSIASLCLYLLGYLLFINLYVFTLKQLRNSDLIFKTSDMKKASSLKKESDLDLNYKEFRTEDAKSLQNGETGQLDIQQKESFPDKHRGWKVFKGLLVTLCLFSWLFLAIGGVIKLTRELESNYRQSYHKMYATAFENRLVNHQNIKNF